MLRPVPIVRLSELLGQPAAAEFLRGIVARGRPAGAYLFQGPAGVGKGTAALAFARALLCERVAGALPADSVPGLFESSTVEAAPAATAADDACGECAACHKTADFQHVDLKFLFPVSGEERDLDQTIAETLQALRTDPLFAFTYEKAASIRLSHTRELIRELAYQPFEAGRRVVVVRDADRMREDQYSALLKSLEEPGPSTIWVLTTSRPSRLPATIRSRCQKVRFAPLPELLLREVLESEAQVPAAEARVLAALSGGSLTRALALSDTEPLEARDQALKLLQPALSGDGPGLWKAIQTFMKFGRVGRETLRRLFEIHQLWLRDLLRIQAGATREALANGDREAELRRQAERVTPREIRRRLMVLEEALQSIDGNISPDLTVFSAMSRVAGARLGEGEWPAHPAARWDY
jgi:DNA polymerase-3 subunit delta'